MTDAERIRMLEAAVIELLERLAELEWRVLPFEANPQHELTKGGRAQ